MLVADLQLGIVNLPDSSHTPSRLYCFAEFAICMRTPISADSSSVK